MPPAVIKGTDSAVYIARSLGPYTSFVYSPQPCDSTCKFARRHTPEELKEFKTFHSSDLVRLDGRYINPSFPADLYRVTSLLRWYPRSTTEELNRQESSPQPPLHSLHLTLQLAMTELLVPYTNAMRVGMGYTNNAHSDCLLFR